MADEEQGNACCLAVQGEDVSFRFGKRSVLDGLYISVERGVIYGLLGPSGCGKTTLLRCLVGRHRPSSGSVKIYGKSPGQRGFCIPGSGVGYMPQELALYPEINTEETLTYFGRIYQMSEKDIKERISFLAEFLDIPDKKIQIKKLSGGEQRRISFAAALIHKPPLVLLDEPTVGVDPLLRKSIWDYLQRLATVDFLTIIITTHYVEEARQAHIVGLMRDGRLLAEADPEYLITKHQALTLEDVFLNLCEKNSHSPKADRNSRDGLHKSNEESQKDIWVPLKAERPYNCLRRSKDDLEHKNGLLSDSFQPHSVLARDRGIASATKRSSVRLGALTKKNFIRAKRNIPLVIAQIICPTLQAIIFCLCVGREPFDLSLAVVNMETDPSGKSNYFLEHLNPHTIQQIRFSNLTSAIESVEKGEHWGVLYIGPTFTDSLINRHLEGIHVDNETIEASSIKLYLDMSNHQITLTLHTKILEAFNDFARNMARIFNQNPLLAEPPVILGKPIYGREKPDFTEFMAPGMIVSMTYIMSISLSAMVIIIEKKEGLLDRSWIAGVQYWEVIISIMIPLFIVMVLQEIAILICTFLVFSIPCRGSLLWVIIAVFLVGLEGVSFGLFVSSICSNENIAMMITMGVFYPNVILSGIIWPLEAMPYYVKQLSYCLPLTLIINSVRCVISKGWSIADHGIWNGYLVAIMWIIPVIMISSIFFKYKK